MYAGFWRRLGALFFAACLLTGCTRQIPEPTAYRVVSQIHIQYENDQLHRRWHLYSDEKMEAVLTRLRLLDPYGTPTEDPDTAPGSDIYIALIYSDGTRKLYLQRAARYLQIENGPWKCIDPDRALELCALLGVLTSDEPEDDQLPFDTPPIL